MSRSSRAKPGAPGAVKVKLPPSKPGRKPKTRWYKTQADADHALAKATQQSRRGHKHSAIGRQRTIHKLLVSQLLDQQDWNCFFCKRPLRNGWKLSHKKLENQPDKAILVCRVCDRKSTARRKANRPRRAQG